MIKSGVLELFDLFKNLKIKEMFFKNSGQCAFTCYSQPTTRKKRDFFAVYILTPLISFIFNLNQNRKLYIPE